MGVRRKQESVDRLSSLVLPKSGSAAIPFRHPLVRDALVVASLDPTVRAIEHLPTLRSTNAAIDVDAIVLERNDGRRCLDVIEARTSLSIAQQIVVADALSGVGIIPLTMSEAEIRAEPRWTNARTVWANLDRLVPIGLRLQVLGILTEETTMPLADILTRVRTDHDPATAIMALACGNLIELDLVSGPLGPRTLVRLRE